MISLDGYTAFIDLLGTKESANVHGSSFAKAINEFTNVATSSALILSNDSKIYLFSDCAFISFTDFTNFIQYIAEVRYQLFSGSYFFKCALIPGRLSAEKWNPPKLVKTERVHLEKIVSGTTFGPPSVEAFMLHEQFKGVGVCVDPRISAEGLVNTAYFRTDDYKSIVTSIDVRYSEKEIGGLCQIFSEEDVENNGADDRNREAEEYIRVIFSSIVTAKTKQRKYGKYYISTIISLIKSSNFSLLRYDDSDGWVNYPIVFRHLFINNFVEKRLSDVLGWELCYIAAIGEWLSQADPPLDITYEALVRELVRRPRVARKISSAPKSLIDSQSRETLLKQMAALSTKGMVDR